MSPRATILQAQARLRKKREHLLKIRGTQSLTPDEITELEDIESTLVSLNKEYWEKGMEERQAKLELRRDVTVSPAARQVFAEQRHHEKEAKPGQPITTSPLLIEECQVQGGCCSRSCGCCGKPRATFDTGAVYSHCISDECPCCVESRETI